MGIKKHDGDIIKLFFLIAKKRGHLKLDTSHELTEGDFTVFRGSLHAKVEKFLIKGYGKNNVIYRERIDKEKNGLWKKYFQDKRNEYKTRVGKFELDNLIIGCVSFLKMYNSSLKQLDPDHKRAIAWYLGFLDYDDVGVDLGEGEDSTLRTKHKELFKEPLENKILSKEYHKFKNCDSSVPGNDLPQNPVQSFLLQADSLKENFKKKKDKLIDLNASTNEAFSVREELYRIIDNLEEIDSIINLSIPETAKERDLKSTFDTIIKAEKLKLSHKVILEKYIGGIGRANGYKWHDRSILASALTYSLLSHFDEAKANYLGLLIINHEEDSNSDVLKKATIGLFLCIALQYRNKRQIRRVQQMFNNLVKIPNVRKTLKATLTIILDNKLRNEYHIKEIQSDDLYIRSVPFYKGNQLFDEVFVKNSLNIDTSHFTNLLAESISLTKFLKYSVLYSYEKLSIEQVEELILIFENEIDQLNKLHAEFPEVYPCLLEDHHLSELLTLILYKSPYLNELIKISTDTDSQILLLNTLYDIIELSDDNQFAIWTLIEIAQRYEKNKKINESINIRHKLKEIDPNNKFNLHALGRCYQNLEKHEIALKYHLDFHNLDPGNFYNLKSLGFCFRMLNRFEDAIDFYKKAFRIKSDDIQILENIAWCSFILGDIDTTHQFYLKELEIHNNDCALMNLGHVHLIRHNKQKAYSYYERSLVICKSPSFFWDGMEDDFQHLEQYGITREQYDKVLAELKQKIKQQEK